MKHPAPAHPSHTPSVHLRRRRRFTVSSPGGPGAVTYILFSAFIIAAALWFAREDLFQTEEERAPVVAEVKKPSLPPPDPERFRKDLESVKGLEKQGGAQFSNADQVVDRYAALLRRHHGNPSVKKVEQQRQDYLRRLGESAATALADVRRSAKEPRGRGALGEVLALYRAFPVAFLKRSDEGKEAQREIDALVGKINGKYQIDKARAESLLRAGEGAEATALLEEMLIYVDAERRKEIERRLDDIREKENRNAERATDDLHDDYLVLSHAVRKTQSERRYAEASDQLVDFLLRRTTAEQERLLRGSREGFSPDKRDSLLPWIDRRLRERPTGSEPFLIDLRNALLLAEFARDVEAKEKKKWDDVRSRPAEEIEGIFLAAVGGKAAAAPNLKLGLFWYGENGDNARKKATSYLETAAGMGASGTDQLRLSLGNDLSLLRRERFEREYAVAAAAFARRQWDIVDETLSPLLAEKGGKELLKEKGDEAARMLASAKQRLDLIRRLAKETEASVVDEGEDRFRFSYDFERADHLRAFPPVDGRRGTWEIVNGRLDGRGSPAVMWKRLIDGDVTVEFTLYPVEEQNIAVNLFYSKVRDQQYYSCIFGLNLVEGDIERKHGLPNVGIFKYPIEAKVKDWLLPSFWEEWNRRTVGRALGNFRIAALGKYRVRIERKGTSIKILADGAAVWEGEDGDYSRGNVVFSLSNSKAQIDDLFFTIPVKEPPLR